MMKASISQKSPRESKGKEKEKKEKKKKKKKRAKQSSRKRKKSLNTLWSSLTLLKLEITLKQRKKLPLVEKTHKFRFMHHAIYSKAFSPSSLLDSLSEITFLHSVAPSVPDQPGTFTRGKKPNFASTSQQSLATIIWGKRRK
jgi:hypothetical protein